MLKHLTKSLLLLLVLQFADQRVGNAYEYERDVYSDRSSVGQSENQAYPVNVSGTKLSWQNDYTQNQKGNLKSQSQVVREVKNRYNAEVLRVSLSQNGRIYNVRVLMPNGRVKNIKVNAQR